MCSGHIIPSTILCYEYNYNWNNASIINNDKWAYQNVSICQWFIISEPKQEIFLKMLMRCFENIDFLINLDKNDSNYHFNVLNTTGPLGFTKVVLENMTDKISILPPDFFCAGSGSHNGEGGVPLTNNSYVKHHFTHSWK